MKVRANAIGRRPPTRTSARARAVWPSPAARTRTAERPAGSLAGTGMAASDAATSMLAVATRRPRAQTPTETWATRVVLTATVSRFAGTRVAGRIATARSPGVAGPAGGR